MSIADRSPSRTASLPARASPTSGGRPAGSPSRSAGAETGNAFAQFEIDEPARRRDRPCHVHHNEDETFYILEGEVTMLVGDERIDLVAGDYCFAPRGVPHAYIVRSERARMLVTISPAGIEQLFVSLGVPVTGAEPPTEVVMPPMPEMARLFARLRRRDPRPAAHARRALTGPRAVTQLGSGKREAPRCSTSTEPSRSSASRRRC